MAKALRQTRLEQINLKVLKHIKTKVQIAIARLEMIKSKIKKFQVKKMED